MNVDISFTYEGKGYHLVEGKHSDYAVEINGVTYSILGEEKQIEKFARFLQSLSKDSDLTIDQLKEKLAPSPDLSVSHTKKGQEIGKTVLRSKDDTAILPDKPFRPRSHSLPTDRALSTTQTKKEYLAKKSGHMWECIESEPDKYSHGRIDTFRMRDDYNESGKFSLDRQTAGQAFRKKTIEIFPAVEPHANYIKFFFSNNRLASVLNELGYSFSQDNTVTTLKLPDREALMARWEKLREKMPELGEFLVESSEGVATDHAFTESFFLYDVLLSNGIETFHDHTTHILPTIAAILYSIDNPTLVPPYQVERLRIRREIASLHYEIETAKLAMTEMKFTNTEEKKQLLKEIERAEMFLGAIIDDITTQTAIARSKFEKSMLNEMQKGGGKTQSLHFYMTKRFGDKNFQETQKEIAQSWNKIDAINAELKRARTQH